MSEIFMPGTRVADQASPEPVRVVMVRRYRKPRKVRLKKNGLPRKGCDPMAPEYRADGRPLKPARCVVNAPGRKTDADNIVTPIVQPGNRHERRMRAARTRKQNTAAHAASVPLLVPPVTEVERRNVFRAYGDSIPVYLDIEAARERDDVPYWQRWGHWHASATSDGGTGCRALSGIMPGQWTDGRGYDASIARRDDEMLWVRTLIMVLRKLGCRKATVSRGPRYTRPAMIDAPTAPPRWPLKAGKLATAE